MGVSLLEYFQLEWVWYSFSQIVTSATTKTKLRELTTLPRLSNWLRRRRFALSADEMEGVVRNGRKNKEKEEREREGTKGWERCPFGLVYALVYCCSVYLHVNCINVCFALQVHDSPAHLIHAGNDIL